MAFTRDIKDPASPGVVSGVTSASSPSGTDAAAIEFVGSQVIEAAKGLQKGSLQSDVDREIGNFFARREVEATGAVEQQAQRVSSMAEEFSADGLSPEEKKELTAASKELSRTAEIVRQGTGSQLELKARIEAKTKEYINRMPGLAQEFRAVASNELNDYASRISMVGAERSMEQEMAQQQSRYLQGVADWAGIPVQAVNNKHIADFQTFRTAENQADLAENLTKRKDFDITQRVAAVDQAAASRKVMGMFQINRAIGSLKVSGKPIGERLREGDSYESILSDLFKNENDLIAFRDNVKQGIDALKREISTYYAQKQAELGLPAERIERNREAQLKPLNALSESVETINDAKRLATLVGNMNKYQEGIAAGFAAGHPAFMISKRNGMINSEMWRQFSENPANMQANNPEMYRIMKSVATDASLADKYIALHNHLLISPENFNSDIMMTDPDMRKALGTTARKGYEQILLQGFEEGDTEQLQNSFVNYGRLLLTQVKNEDPNSLEAFERYFTDPKFMTRLEQLPEEKRGELLEPVAETAIDTIAGVNGIVERIGMEEIPAGGFMYYNSIGNRLDITGIREGVFSSSSAEALNKDVRKLDRYLKLLHKSKSVSGQTETSYGDFVSGFISKLNEAQEGDE